MADPTIKEALLEASKRLRDPKVAALLMQHHLTCDPVSLILNDLKPLAGHEAYFSLVQRYAEHEPLEYITQKVSFYSREFFITQGALIPRPETELLIDHVFEVTRTCHKPLRIAEIGTGSGIIAVMLALLIENVHVTATDISNKALEIAKINAERFGVLDKITFVHTSFLEGIESPFDLIVSNPPYIADDFPLEPHLLHEPHNALFGGRIGDEILKNIIDLWLESKTPHLVCEMGYDQKASLSAYLEKIGMIDFSFYPDLAGLDRGFCATKHGG